MWQLHQGDCVEVMRTLPDNSIDLTVTSPPYDNLRTYKGFSFDFEGTAQELYRVTKQGGVVVWVVGDATIKGSETGTSFRQALYFKEIGFNLHDTMIYVKRKLPINCKRYDQRFEYMFVLTKGAIETFNPLMVKNKQAGRTNTGAKQRQKDGSTKKIHDDSQIKEYAIMGNVWEVYAGYMRSTKDKNAYQHPAIFPEQLAHDHILSWSNEGDTVLDPFAGSGTTLKMAERLGRHSIGVEIAEEYCEIIRTRMTGVQYDTQA